MEALKVMMVNRDMVIDHGGDHLGEDRGKEREGEPTGYTGVGKDYGGRDYTHPGAARYVALSHSPVTEQARQLGEHLMAQIDSASPRQRARRQADHDRLSMVITALIADLFLAAGRHPQRWSYRSISSRAFDPSTPIGYKPFMTLFKTMETLSLIEVMKGGNRKHPFADGEYAAGKATRFRALPSLMDMALEHGITPGNARDHFTVLLPREVIILRGSSHRVGRDKIKGPRLRLDMKPELARMEEHLKAINAFLAAQDIEGGLFPGYQRIFNEGDREDFKWDKGGRLYCRGEESYQTAKKASRLAMTVNESPVVEIDISASYLTMYAHWMGVDFPHGVDPYEIEGLERPYVKAWVTATLGHDRFHTRWPQEASKMVREAGLMTGGNHTMTKVGEKVLEALPFLRDWPETPVRWSDLMYTESQAVFGTLVQLNLSYGIPAMAVHDSIIVPEEKAETAMAILMDHYLVQAGVLPRLKVNHPDGSSETFGPQDRASMKPAILALPSKLGRLLEQHPQDASQVA